MESYTYSGFGVPTIRNSQGGVIAASSVGNRSLFTGREYLAGIGIYDYRNRMYSAALGRFLQTDPRRLKSGDINFYRYAGNNPADIRDPNGTGFIGALVDGVAGFVAGFTGTLADGGSPGSAVVAGLETGAITGLIGFVDPSEGNFFRGDCRLGRGDDC